MLVESDGGTGGRVVLMRCKTVDNLVGNIADEIFVHFLSLKCCSFSCLSQYHTSVLSDKQ